MAKRRAFGLLARRRAKLAHWARHGDPPGIAALKTAVAARGEAQESITEDRQVIN
jgi:hypothetical protein